MNKVEKENTKAVRAFSVKCYPDEEKVLLEQLKTSNEIHFKIEIARIFQVRRWYDYTRIRDTLESTVQSENEIDKRDFLFPRDPYHSPDLTANNRILRNEAARALELKNIKDSWS